MHESLSQDCKTATHLSTSKSTILISVTIHKVTTNSPELRDCIARTVIPASKWRLKLC